MVFFLVVTLGLEASLHHIRAFLRRRRKAGLLAAVNHLSSELMLLGVASLILTALEPSLETSRQCPVDFKQQCDEAQANGAKSAVVGGAGSEVFGPKHRALLAAGGEPGAAASNLTFMADGGAAVDDGAADAGDDLVCDGPAQAVWPECQNRPGYAPVVTSDTVEEIHMFLFFIAVVHIAVGITAMVLSTLKLKLWRYLSGPEADDPCMQRALSVRRLLASGAMPAPPSPPAPGKGGALELQGLSRDSAAGAADGGAAGGAQGPHADVEAGVDTAGRPQAPGGGAAGDGKAPPPRGGAGRHHASASESGDELEDEEEDSEEEAREAALVQLRVEGFGAAAWRGRPKELQGVLAHLEEACAVIWSQVSPWTVTSQEFAVMRASFFLSHDLGPSPPATAFQPYLLECAERDGAQVVGLGLVTWLFIICFVLLSSAVGWCAWIFSIAAGVILLLVNTYLVITVRKMTRGGAVRVLQATPLWRRHRWLLLLIKLLLFLLSFVVSNSVFFGVFFGPESCFFSRTGFQKNPVSWWVILLCDVVMILSVSLVTLPLYALVAHTRAVSPVWRAPGDG
ncbi:hypothetical protein MNEG_13280 [Monoraphidium neglectum]|uniref:MLO-like protein n=1 Tax=Monoraphidium neglectum TaxID=145388 RepID=A0A0D2J461_9CHLO|nr:hypothetical protein MNEG_13280 [Monoraphidium neglectum]KIY94682.1 hypothetical protein MNEG_13280 [Monoraphidium neglectum]|eukprot:XP_013893702.1 hypothetical protein MNEG_13280 [Monoraphidium neglectum]